MSARMLSIVIISTFRSDGMPPVAEPAGAAVCAGLGADAEPLASPEGIVTVAVPCGCGPLARGCAPSPPCAQDHDKDAPTNTRAWTLRTGQLLTHNSPRTTSVYSS